MLLALLIIAGCTGNGKNLILKKISGKVTQTSDYCGGAPPPQELIDELLKEKAFPNKKLYIRESAVNMLSKPVIKEFTVGDNGTFEISLPSGQYCIIEDVKKENLKIPDFSEINKELPSYSQYRIQSEKCFKDWWETCDKILLVNNQDITDFVIKFHHDCGQPCVEGGPLPQ